MISANGWAWSPIQIRLISSENAGLDIMCTFPEWFDAYRNYGVFLGVRIDAKVGQIVEDFVFSQWVSFRWNRVIQ